MDQPPELKTFEITFVTPDNLIAGTEPGKSLNFHRFMRHARECHKNLLEFLIQNSLLNDVGASQLIADERKTLLECSERIALRIRALPFVEKMEESRDNLQQQGMERRRGPAAGR